MKKRVAADPAWGGKNRAAYSVRGTSQHTHNGTPDLGPERGKTAASI